MANGGGPFGIGDQILKGFIGTETLRDYTHASRTFTTNSYELKPRYKFLYHVSFTINTQEIPYLRGVFAQTNFPQTISLLVKTAELPKYVIQHDTLNQYNRKRVVQTRIDYQPVTLTFHDDGGDNARRLWYYYYSYYYADPANKYDPDASVTNGNGGTSANRTTGFGYNARDIYDKSTVVKDWGYIGETSINGYCGPTGKPPFFRDIRIYGLDQRKFAEYVLINPIITAWNHDQYDYSQGAGVMQHSMTVAYETVKYYSGAVGASRPDTNVKGFADPTHYDTRPSPIARPGATQTIFGQGGLLDAGEGIINDLQKGTLGGLIGAVQTAGRTYNTWKNANIRSTVINEAVALGQNTILQGANSQAVRQVMNSPTGIFIPTPQRPAGQ